MQVCLGELQQYLIDITNLYDQKTRNLEISYRFSDFSSDNKVRITTFSIHIVTAVGLFSIRHVALLSPPPSVVFCHGRVAPPPKQNPGYVPVLHKALSCDLIFLSVGLKY